MLKTTVNEMLAWRSALNREARARRVARKCQRGLCETLRCMNRRRKSGFKCNTCESRLKESRNPFRATYRNLKVGAQRRGIPFLLTFDQFKDFAIKSDHLQLKGNKGSSQTVDRIDETKGYEVGNIQPLTRAANSRKHQKWKAMRLACGHGRPKSEIQEILNDYGTERSEG